MKRALLITLLLPLIVLARPLPARAAGIDALWCKSDPVVLLNGTIVDITAEIPLEYLSLVNGPVAYVVQTPTNVTRSVVVTDLGYNGYGATVKFTNRTWGLEGKRFWTSVRVTVPIDRSRLAVGESVPVRLTVFPQNALPMVIEGTSAGTVMSLWIRGQ